MFKMTFVRISSLGSLLLMRSSCAICSTRDNRWLAAAAAASVLPRFPSTASNRMARTRARIMVMMNEDNKVILFQRGDVMMEGIKRIFLSELELRFLDVSIRKRKCRHLCCWPQSLMGHQSKVQLCPITDQILLPIHCLKKKIRKRMEIIVVSSRGVFSGFSFLCPAATPDLENTTWIAT